MASVFDSNITDLIAKIDNWTKANRPEYYAKLLPGATLAEISELETKFGIILPEAFKLFLTWRNGQDENNLDNFFTNFGLMSISEISEIFEMLNHELDIGEFERDNWWNKQWLPFLQNWSGDHYCIDLVGSFGGKAGQILTFWHDWEERKIVFESFEDFLRTVSTILETLGDVTPDEDLVASRKIWNLVATLNPGYPKSYQAG